MKAEEYVRKHAPKIKVCTRPGVYSGGGRVRYEIMLGRKMIGCDTRESSAWAEAMRWLKLNRKERAK